MKLIKNTDEVAKSLNIAQIELGKALDFIDLLVASTYDSKSTVAERVGLHLAEVVEELQKVEKLLANQEGAIDVSPRN